MSTELTNLVPASSARAFRRRYFMRLAAVALLLAALVVVLHGILLVPTYLYVRDEVARDQAALAGGSAGTQSAEQAQLLSRTNALKGMVAALSQVQSSPTATAAIRAVLLVPRPGITLSGFTYSAPAAANAQAHLGISGVADSRDALRAFTAALGQLPFVSSADLPISAYAKETAIPFTITLSGTLQP